MDADSLLHNSCKLYPDTFDIVEGAVQLDPEAIRRKIPIVCTQLKDETDKSAALRAPAKFCYPINIALAYGANQQIIELLARSGPDVLSFPDGDKEETSLAIALRYQAKQDILDILLRNNQDCASIGDRHSNLPLHVAVRSCDGRPLSLDRITHIHSAFPDAVMQHNFHGESPVDLAVRNPHCPEPVLNYLQRVSFRKMERNAVEMDGAVGFDDRGI